MKNEYALDFAPDRVTLLSGTGKDQAPLGEVLFDDPFFSTRLEDLRKEVEEGGSAPLSPTLLIPHSEVLFHTMKVEEGADDATRVKAVTEELEDMTPYAVEDLVFDWKSISKTQVQIAAVARDTLDEADDFAAQHGFGPGSFSTHLKAGAFRGQPDFGASARPLPEPEQIPEPAPEPEPMAAPEPANSLVMAPDAKAASDPDLTSAEAEQESSAPPEMVASDSVTQVPVTTAKQEVAKLATAATETEEASDTKPATLATESKADVTDAEDATVTAPLPKPESPQVGAAGSFASRRSAESSGRMPSGPDSTRLTDIASRIAMLPDGGAGPKTASTPGLSNTKGTKNTGKDAGNSGAFDSAAAGAAAAAVMSTGATAPSVGATATRRAPAPSAPTPTVRRVEPPSDSAAPRIGEARPKPALTEAEALTVFGMRDTGRSSLAAFLPVLIGLAVAVVLAVVIWSIFFFLNPVEQGEDVALNEGAVEIVPAPATPLPDDTDVANITPDELIPPGPDSNSVDEIPPAATDREVAALPEIDNPEPTVEETAEPAAEPVTEDPAGSERPLVIVEETAPDETPLVIVEERPSITSDSSEQTVAEPEAAAEQNVASTQPSPEPLPDDPLRRSADAPEATRYAATGVSTTIPEAPAPPQTEAAQVDTAPISNSTVDLRETVALLAAPDQSTFSAPPALLPPPPANARFEFGPDGRIVATPEGSLTPQGITVTSGRPARVPPLAPNRPDRDQPAVEDAAANAPETAAGTSPDEAPTADSAPQTPATDTPAATVTDESNLDIPVIEGRPARVPPSRPESDQAATPAADVDATRVALGGTTLTTLSGIAPRPRAEAIEAPSPDTATTEEPLVPTRVALLTPPRARPGAPEVAETPDPQLAAETAAAIAAILPEAVPAPEPVVATSPYAVASSLLPVGRPRGLEQRAQQRRAEQQKQQKQAEPVRVATAAAVVTPRNPTRGSVASRATEPNKIKLSDVNLIGVYGTNSNRRALVRLPNGRFVKVKVGDKVDGGRVSAIGADALRYEKRGRSLTLQMPSG